MLKDRRKLAHVPSLTEQEGIQRGKEDKMQKKTQMEKAKTQIKIQNDIRREQTGGGDVLLEHSWRLK